jgi:hypothetical protein
MNAGMGAKHSSSVRLERLVEYAGRRTVWLDLKILGKTIPVVLGRRGVA